MRRSINRLLCVLVCSAMVTSCSSMSPEARDQIFGGVGGAALGAGIGALATGGNTKAMIAGAAAGAVAGWAAVKLVQYHAEKTRSAKQEATTLGYRPADGTVVKLHNAGVTPDRIRPGSTVDVEMDYAVLAPPGTRDVVVKESWQVEKDGEVLLAPPSKTETREPGGWRSGASIDVPREAKNGTYVVKNRVTAGNSYDERVAVFTVR